MTGATYLVDLNGPGVGTNVSGDVNLQNAMLALSLGFQPAADTTFTIINNGGSGPIMGTFNRLPQDAKVKAGKHKFRISYTGGDGNDVVLTAIK